MHGYGIYVCKTNIRTIKFKSKHMHTSIKLGLWLTIFIKYCMFKWTGIMSILILVDTNLVTYIYIYYTDYVEINRILIFLFLIIFDLFLVILCSIIFQREKLT